MNSISTPFDTPWKDILEAYFPQFMAFFFPQINAHIDWAKGFEFMDGELQQLAKDSETNRLYADKLAKVYLLNGSEQFILAHIEIQCQKEDIFPARVFTYFTRIRDKFKKPVVSLVILGDKNKTWQPQTYQEELFGCRLQFDFPVVKLLQYKQRKAELEDSSNPFAHVVLAHLAALATKQNNQRRRREKIILAKRLYDQAWERQDVINIYRFLDWVLTLPKALEIEFQEELATYEGVRNMPYVTSIERMGIEKGLQEGQLNGQLNMALKFLQRRCGELPPEVRSRLEALNSEQLDGLGDVLDDIVSIEQLIAWLDAITTVNSETSL